MNEPSYPSHLFHRHRGLRQCLTAGYPDFKDTSALVDWEKSIMELLGTNHD